MNSLSDYIRQGLIELTEDATIRIIAPDLMLDRKLLIRMLHGLGPNETATEMAQEIIDALKEMDNE